MEVLLLLHQILASLNDIDMLITVPFTVITGTAFLYRKCKKIIRRKSLKKILGYDKVVIHIPTRIANETLGEHRLKPVIAKEDYNTYERLREVLSDNGFEVSITYIPARSDERDRPGELELSPDCANIVVCGPKNSKTVEDIFTSLEGLNFAKGTDGWYFEDLVRNKKLSSPLADNNNQYAFCGRVLIGNTRILLICGIHAIGSDGVAYFLGDTKKLDKLLKIVRKSDFYCIVRSSYGLETKEIYAADVTQCMKIFRVGEMI